MRWSYLLTRFFILALIVIAVWIGKDPLLRYAIIQSGQSMTGAKVEIGKVHSSLFEGKIYLSELAIVDPRSTMQNLVQAESAFLKLNPQNLLRRELVIEKGSTSQLVFGAPRTTSGALGSVARDENQTLATSVFSHSNEPLEQDWLDQFLYQNGQNSTTELETIRVAQKIQQTWPNRIKEQHQVVLELKGELKRVNALLQIQDPNPLRDQKRIDKASSKLVRLREKSESLRQKLQQLMTTAESDRDSLFAAKERDQKRISESGIVNQFDRDVISRVLLSSEQQKYADDVVRWFAWFRNAVPNPETDLELSPKRGVNIRFAGQQPQPEILIKSLDLDGEGRLANQHFHFSGVAKNITTQPKLHDQPVTFQLRAQGKHHVVVECSLDRRQDVWRDSLNIHSPNLSLPNQNLGDESRLAVDVSPCRMQSDVKLSTVGDRLSGNIIFRHSEFVVQITKLQQLAGGQDLADYVNLDLATLDQYEVKAEFSGTLAKPEVKFTSDLGAKLAKVMNKVSKSRAFQLVEKQKKQLEQVLDQHFEIMDKQIIVKISELAAALNEESSTIAELSKNLTEEDSTLPRIR